MHGKHKHINASLYKHILQLNVKLIIKGVSFHCIAPARQSIKPFAFASTKSEMQ